MPTTTIHFIRHGKVYNPDHLLYERLPGFHLSDRGMRMAQATGAYIAADPKLNTVAAVYSSPLERTRETAGAILDALKAVALPAVEVHLSDVSAREPFRQISYAGMACVKTYMGLGFEGYRQAILYLKQYLEEANA